MSPSDSTPAAEKPEGYGLPEVFEALRHDLVAAQDKLRDEKRDPVMKLGGAEIELTFTLQRDTKGKGGVNLKVFGVGFEAGGERGRTESAVHKIKIMLEPSADDTDVLGDLE